MIFQFTEISIQVIPKSDLCFIFKNGFPIWSGNKDELVDILEELQKTTLVDIKIEHGKNED
jgi:hypothetical protein